MPVPLAVYCATGPGLNLVLCVFIRVLLEYIDTKLEEEEEEEELYL